MNKIKPCPFCGKAKLFFDTEKTGLLYGCGIGCLSPSCVNHKLLIQYAFSKDRAMKKAISAWNRRATNE